MDYKQVHGQSLSIGPSTSSRKKLKFYIIPNLRCYMNLNPWYVGLYEILKKIGNVA